MSRKEKGRYPSSRGSEVYVHSGLAESWGALDSEGIGDPDELRETVERIEEINAVDDSTPEGAAKIKELEQKFIAELLVRCSPNNTSSVVSIRESEHGCPTSGFSHSSGNLVA